MSYTAYGVNGAMAVKLWSKTLRGEANKSIDIDPLIGGSDASVIQEKSELEKDNGDQVTFSLSSADLASRGAEGPQPT